MEAKENRETTFCPLLIKLTSWPKWLNDKKRVSDLLFKSANRYVLIDAEEVLDELFIVDEEYPLVRLCINALKHLDNQQLAFVLHYIDLLQEMTYLESEISEDEYEETLQTILLEKFGEDCYDAVLTLIESYKP